MHKMLQQITHRLNSMSRQISVNAASISWLNTVQQYRVVFDADIEVAFHYDRLYLLDFPIGVRAAGGYQGLLSEFNPSYMRTEGEGLRRWDKRMHDKVFKQEWEGTVLAPQEFEDRASLFQRKKDLPMSEWFSDPNYRPMTTTSGNNSIEIMRYLYFNALRGRVRAFTYTTEIDATNTSTGQWTSALWTTISGNIEL